MYKKYVLRLIGVSVGLLILCAATVFLLDPAFQYHLPLSGIEATYTNERYQNAGLIKNEAYDSICIGSSVTSNFRASWFDERFGGKTLKVSYPGGTFSDFDLALETAYATHDIKQVYWSLDPRLLSDDPQDSHEMPTYLYDFNPLNDVQYLLNKDILLESCASSVIASLTHTATALDEAFLWETPNTKYGLDVAIASYTRPKDIGFQYDRHMFDDALHANLEIIDKWVNGHPETTFYLYFPPYSTLYFDSIKRQGQIDAMMFLLYDTANRYKDKENVRFYSFIDQNKITTNYENYTDMVHYRSEVNRYIVDYMADNPPMDDAAVSALASHLRSLMENYDFDSLYPPSVQEKYK